MPQKNTIKEYAPESFYHVYSRGTNKQKIFNDLADYKFFVSLFNRYLSGQNFTRKSGEPYPDFSKVLKLQAYCLMPNHLHLLLYQGSDSEALRKFMSGVMTSYSKYFNKKYKRVGTLFESRYKARRIDSDAYLSHIGRYIHMNPRNWLNYKFSSLRFVFESEPKWLSVSENVSDFGSREEYISFLRQYQENKDSVEEVKHLLADK